MARDAVVLEQALRWPKAASSRSGRSGAVFVGRRPELLGSGAAPLHAAVPRDHLRQLVGAHAAGEGLALRRRQPAFFGEAPLRRRVAGRERGAGFRVLNFGPSPIPAICPVPGAKKGSPFPRAPLQGVRVARLRSRPIPLGEGGIGS